MSAQDTLPRKEERKLDRHQRRLALRESHQRTIIGVSSVYSFLSTSVTFELLDEILNVRLGLEKNLGLADKDFFLTGSVMHRFTPKSGLFARYYGINRSKKIATDRDYIFLRDTIPAGSSIEAFFRTQVLSVGYLLTILDNSDAFLGAYLNLYLMDLETGVNSLIGKWDPGLLAPFPEFGLIARFQLTRWLFFDGDIGFFALNTPNFGGWVNTLKAQFTFKPVRWFGIGLGYQQFNVQVYFPEKEVKTVVDYVFRGPELGLVVNF